MNKKREMEEMIHLAIDTVLRLNSYPGVEEFKSSQICRLYEVLDLVARDDLESAVGLLHSLLERARAFDEEI